MDPFAHTFFGATLAETGLRKLSRYATPTLILGANAPDIDAVTMFLGRDASLYLRRGWTHGVLALVVLPLVLVGLIWIYHRVRGRSREGPDIERVHFGRLVGLSYLATWSHPALDWMNTYGVRLLMPFDGQWFYGDTLFIVDPWFWLLTVAGVVLARSQSRKAIVGWAVLGVLATTLIVLVPLVPVWVKVLWVLGVATIVLLRSKPRSEVFVRSVARLGAVSLVLYIGVVFGMARFAESAAAGETAPLEIQSNPMPGVPFEHRVVLVYPERYRVVPPHGDAFDVPRQEPDKVVRAAMRDASIRGFTNWTRYPYWSVHEEDGGWRVEFRDLRYVDPGEEPRGIGYAEVHVRAEDLP